MRRLEQPQHVLAAVRKPMFEVRGHRNRPQDEGLCASDLSSACLRGRAGSNQQGRRGIRAGKERPSKDVTSGRTAEVGSA